MKIRRMRIACLVTKATDKHLRMCMYYSFSTVIVITRKPLNVKHIACLVRNKKM